MFSRVAGDFKPAILFYAVWQKLSQGILPSIADSRKHFVLIQNINPAEVRWEILVNERVSVLSDMLNLKIIRFIVLRF